MWFWCFRLQDLSYIEIKHLERALSLYFPNPAFNRNSVIRYTVPQFPPRSEWHKMGCHLKGIQQVPIPVSDGKGEIIDELDSFRKVHKPDAGVNFFVLPLKVADDVAQNTYESYHVMLQQLRNQVHFFN